jgi:TPR repeat protein
MTNPSNRWNKYAASAGCALALALGSVAEAADDYQRGLNAYQLGNYRTAFKLLKVSAENGEPQAQHLLGTMYRLGLGVPENEYEGFFWSKRAAEEGLLEAQFQVGLMYLQGEGVTENDDEAQKWLWSAADRGYPQATEVLQYIYSNDFGVGC